MSRSKFYQSAGPFGPMLPTPLKSGWLPTSNPMMNMAVGLNPRPVIRPQPATATIAGRQNIGCCGGCAADYRRSS